MTTKVGPQWVTSTNRHAVEGMHVSGVSEVYTLHNLTTGRAWSYDSEAQLRTATRLFIIQNPTARVAVTIKGEHTVLTEGK